MQHEDSDSLLKVAKLASAFEHYRNMEFIERILVNCKGDINYKIPDYALTKSDKYQAGSTALHLAQTKNRRYALKVSKLLLKHGADITIKNQEKETALHKTINVIRKDRSITTNTRPQYVHFFKQISEPELIFSMRISEPDDVVTEILSTHIRKSITDNPCNKHGLTHFHIACLNGNTAAVEFFMKNGVPVDIVVGKDSPIFPGCTALHIAVKNSDLEVVEVLLEYGANQFLKDNKGMTAIHELIERNRKILDFVVLEEKELVNYWFEELERNQRIIYLLLNNNNKIEDSIFMDEIGLSNLHVACTLGNVSIVEQLLPQVAQIDHQVNANSHLWPGYTALHFAAHFNLDIVKVLLSKGANIMIESKNGDTPFAICLVRYDVSDIHFIMSTQPEWQNITFLDGNTKLLDVVSAMQNCNGFESYLNKYAQDINTFVCRNSSLWPGFTLLHLAVLFSEQIKKRTNYRRTMSVYQKTVERLFFPDLGLVEKCLIRGADVTAQDLFGSTPLHLAFRYQKTAVIKKLLQFHHSGLNPVDKYNLSHLHIACATSNENIAIKLIESGANLNMAVLSDFKLIIRGCDMDVRRIPAGSMPLHAAVASGNDEIVKLLVNNGANVNAVDENGLTPIHCLLIYNDLWSMSCEVLLSASNLKEVVVTDVGLSHLHIASYCNHANAVKRLLDLGANVNTRLGDDSTMSNFCDCYGICWSEDCIQIPAKATALQAAVCKKNEQSTEAANLLVEHIADILSKDADGTSLLYKMVFGNRVEHFISFITFLYQNEALSRRFEEESGLTRIHIATFLVDTGAVRKVIDRKVDVNARINDDVPHCAGCTPLHLLIRHSLGRFWSREKIVETVKLLLTAGADVMLSDAEGSTPLQSVYKHWNLNATPEIINTVKELTYLMFNSLKDFSNMDFASKQELPLFHIACFQNDLSIMKKFLEHGVDINMPISYFSSIRMKHFVPGSLPIHLVMKARCYDKSLPQIETINFLLEHGADVNSQDMEEETPLHCAVCYAPDRVDIFEKLIGVGADLNKLNASCNTPFELLLCSVKSTPEGIKLFIDQGCGVNVFNEVNQVGYLTRPVTRKQQSDETAIWETLFKSPDITKSDTKGRTAIHNIVSVPGTDVYRVDQGKYSTLIARLCNIGCNIDFQNQSGQTALHFATRFHNYKAVAALLTNGADVNIADSFDKTALTYGIENYYKHQGSYSEYNNMMETFYNHVKKIQHLKLSLSNDYDKDLECRIGVRSSSKQKLITFVKNIDDISSFKLREGSISLRLNDLLSETGIVATYPLKASVRFLIDKFSQNIDAYLGQYGEVISIFKLQIRKAAKRVLLIDLAKESLKVCVPIKPFPFPEICCNVVLRFLSNADLENLITSTKDD